MPVETTSPAPTQTRSGMCNLLTKVTSGKSTICLTLQHRGDATLQCRLPMLPAASMPVNGNTATDHWLEIACFKPVHFVGFTLEDGASGL